MENRIKVTNITDDILQNVQVIDIIPEALMLEGEITAKLISYAEDGSVITETIEGFDYDEETNKTTFNIGALKPGQVAEIKIRLISKPLEDNIYEKQIEYRTEVKENGITKFIDDSIIGAVIIPNVEVSLITPENAYVGDKVQYQILINNKSNYEAILETNLNLLGLSNLEVLSQINDTTKNEEVKSSMNIPIINLIPGNTVLKIIVNGQIADIEGATKVENTIESIIRGCELDSILEQTGNEFEYSKTKEMIAYLIDRKGTLCSTKEIMAILFEDDDKMSYFQRLRRDFLETFESIGYTDIILQSKGQLGIDKDKIYCDYFDYLNGQTDLYNGEYMTQYEFGEFTNSILNNKNAKE